MDYQDILVITGLTTGFTTATLIPIMYKFREHICDEIRDLAIRIGVMEKKNG